MDDDVAGGQINAVNGEDEQQQQQQQFEDQIQLQISSEEQYDNLDDSAGNEMIQPPHHPAVDDNSRDSSAGLVCCSLCVRD